MNVLIITNQPFPNGMAGSKRVKLFAEYLAEKNKVKVIVVGNNNEQNPNLGIHNKVEYEFIKFSRVKYFFAFNKIKKIVSGKLNKSDKNILFLYDNINITNLLFATIGKKLGYKIVTDIVEDYELTKENESIARKIQYKLNTIIQRKIGSIVDGAVVLSNYLLLKYNKLNKIILIPVSAENLYLNFPEKNDGNIINLVYSGSFGNKDGIVDLIKAFDNIVLKFDNVYLTLSGKITENISQLIKNKEKIRYVGLIPDKSYFEFLYNADILLMTRENSAYANAGFPFKLGEYLATGNPVVATKVSDVESYLIDKVDAIFSEPSNIISLSNAIEYAITNKKESKKIGLNGKEKCRLYFNPAVNGHKLEMFLNKL